MYDLVIKGGTLIDARHELEAPREIAIEGGRIAEVAPEIASDKARETYDASGKLVMPGIITPAAAEVKLAWRPDGRPLRSAPGKAGESASRSASAAPIS